MREEKNKQRFEALMAEKKYTDWSDEEKSWVSENFSNEEVEEWKQIQEFSSSMDNDLVIPDVKSQLMEAFEKQNPGKKEKESFLFYSMPLYKVAALLIVLLGMFWIFENKIMPDEVRIVYSIDTLYKEVMVPDKIWLSDSSTRADYYRPETGTAQAGIPRDPSKIEHDQEEHTNSKASLGKNEKMMLARRVGIFPEIDLISSRNNNKSGESLREDSVWRQYLITTN